jgi:hypothetical protein
MNKVLCLMLRLCLLSESAQADTVRFTCQTEESANIIAEALATSQEKADEVAHPFLVRGRVRVSSRRRVRLHRSSWGDLRRHAQNSRGWSFS